jgi:AraC-like DNA-binding protein
MANYLLGAATLLLFFFSLRLFLFPSKSRRGDFYLAVILLNRSGLNLLYLIVSSGYIVFFPGLLKAITPLFYFTPALFYIYIRSVTTGRSGLRRKDCLHFIPLLIGIADVLPWYLNGPDRWAQDALLATESRSFLFTHFTGDISARTGYTLKPLIHLFYVICSVKLVQSKKVFSRLGNHTMPTQIWIAILIVFPTLLQFVELYESSFLWIDASYVLSHTNQLTSIVFFKVLWLLLMLLVVFQSPNILVNYLFGYGKYLAPSILGDSQKGGNSSSQMEFRSSPDSVKVKDTLTPDQASEIMDNAIKVMQEKKLYLIPDLHISEVSAEMKLPVHHFSFALNHHYKKNFRDWVNNFRVNAFIGRYKLSSELMTIEAVALESGFKNMTTFYNAFRKVTNVSPSEYFSKR